MNQNKVLYALEDRCLYLKMIGSVRHTLCTKFDLLIRQAIEQNQVDKYVIDLREASYLDSTCLGIIARMARHMQSKDAEKPIIVSTNPDINQILNSVQFNSVAQILDDWESLPDQFFDSTVFARQLRPHRDIILESHKELTRMNEENRNKFAAVIESLEKKQKGHS